MKNKIALLPMFSLAAALLLSACGATISNAATQTQEVLAIYTSAAQTIEANTPPPSATPRPTETPEPSLTPTETLTATATVLTPTSVTQNYCDNSVFVSDVSIPDDTVLAPGQAFEKSWAVKNTGSCDWTESYSLTFVSGAMMNGSPLFINQHVPPGQQATISLKLNAPIAPGQYTGVWRLANNKGDPFGQVLSVVIRVGQPETPTGTPAP